MLTNSSQTKDLARVATHIMSSQNRLATVSGYSWPVRVDASSLKAVWPRMPLSTPVEGMPYRGNVAVRDDHDCGAVYNDTRDALHIYVGLAVLLVMAFVFRKKLSSLIPLSMVFLVAVVGEIVDMRDDLMTAGYWRLRASLHDVVNTVFWPTVLTMLHKAGLIFHIKKVDNS